MTNLEKLLTERSTYVGVLTLFAGLGLFVIPENKTEIAGALATIVGAIFTLTTDAITPEVKPPPDAEQPPKIENDT